MMPKVKLYYFCAGEFILTATFNKTAINSRVCTYHVLQRCTRTRTDLLSYSLTMCIFLVTSQICKVKSNKRCGKEITYLNGTSTKYVQERSHERNSPFEDRRVFQNIRLKFRSIQSVLSFPYRVEQKMKEKLDVKQIPKKIRVTKTQ